MHCEYPVDADDEYVTEQGFLPTLPGEFTKLSSSLALFRLSRVLSKVLTELYPASMSHDISLRTVSALADELEEWSNNLAPHLKLVFHQDKPSTNVTSSRAPILVSPYSDQSILTPKELTHPSPWHIITFDHSSTVLLSLLILATRARRQWSLSAMPASTLSKSSSYSTNAN